MTTLVGGNAASRQLVLATLAAAIIRVRGDATREGVFEALRDASDALRSVGEHRRALHRAGIGARTEEAKPGARSAAAKSGARSAAGAESGAAPGEKPLETDPSSTGAKPARGVGSLFRRRGR